MTLTPGTRLGAYEILAVIGAGGMGEVFRARDTRLQRDVALKVLPDTFVRDPDRLARFRRESLVLAALNHPNVAAIFGVEESTDSRRERAIGWSRAPPAGSRRPESCSSSGRDRCGRSSLTRRGSR